MYCKNCGTELNENQSYCSSCGCKVNNSLDSTCVVGNKSKLAAGLLQIFLGGFGVGRFYLGYTGIGIAQLLLTFFTFGIGSIWGLIDGILILTGSVSEDADGFLLRD